MSHKRGIPLLSAFAYWTQCAIASYEIAMRKKSVSASDKKRLFNIAAEMVEDLRIHTPPGIHIDDLTRESTVEDYKNAQARLEYDECVKRLQGAELFYKDEASTSS